MSIGTTPSKADIDALAISFTTSLFNALRKSSEFNDWLAQVTDAQMTQLGYNADDLYAIRAAFQDLSTLNKIAMGEATQATVHDYRQYTKGIYGIGCIG